LLDKGSEAAAFEQLAEVGCFAESSAVRPRAKPFLSWAGGKTRMLGKLLSHLPTTISTYHEPFLGSGAVFFALRERISGGAYLSDLNDELINVWQIVQARQDELLCAIAQYHSRNGATEYYKVRAESPDDPLERAARFFFLNQTAWNALWRVNRWGVFNVPWGARNFRGIDPEFLTAVSASLKDALIQNKDFRESLDQVGKGDFVYLDPPYLPISDTSKFAGYTERRFRLADLNELAKATREISARGATWVMSNRDTEAVRDLFNHGEVIRFTTQRSVAAQNRRDIEARQSPEVIVVGKP
jgi:DNA adenine methylase